MDKEIINSFLALQGAAKKLGVELTDDQLIQLMVVEKLDKLDWRLFDLESLLEVKLCEKKRTVTTVKKKTKRKL